MEDGGEDSAESDEEPAPPAAAASSRRPTLAAVDRLIKRPKMVNRPAPAAAATSSRRPTSKTASGGREREGEDSDEEGRERRVTGSEAEEGFPSSHWPAPVAAAAPPCQLPLDAVVASSRRLRPLLPAVAAPPPRLGEDLEDLEDDMEEGGGEEDYKEGEEGEEPSEEWEGMDGGTLAASARRPTPTAIASPQEEGQ